MPLTGWAVELADADVVLGTSGDCLASLEQKATEQVGDHTVGFVRVPVAAVSTAKPSGWVGAQDVFDTHVRDMQERLVSPALQCGGLGRRGRGGARSLGSGSESCRGIRSGRRRVWTCIMSAQWGCAMQDVVT